MENIDAGRGVWGRRVLFLLVLVSWPLMVFLMWQAFWTVPDATVLAEARMVPPPTMQALLREAGLALAEVLVLGALLWPRAVVWGWRLLVAAVALPVWFLATVPSGLTTVDQVHRRGLAALTVLVWTTLVVAGVSRLAGRGRSSAAPESPRDGA